jgi:hypothetical protein
MQTRQTLRATAKSNNSALEAILKGGYNFKDNYSTALEGAKDTIYNCNTEGLNLLFTYGFRPRTLEDRYALVVALVSAHSQLKHPGFGEMPSTKARRMLTILEYYHVCVGLDITDKEGNTVLWEFADDAEACKLAIELGVSRRHRNKKGKTAYEYALDCIDKKIEFQQRVMEACRTLSTSEEFYHAGIDEEAVSNYNPQCFGLEISGYIECLDVIRV